MEKVLGIEDFLEFPLKMGSFEEVTMNNLSSIQIFSHPQLSF
jgi:hypothetical protein